MRLNLIVGPPTGSYRGGVNSIIFLAHTADIATGMGLLNEILNCLQGLDSNIWAIFRF